MGGSPPCDPRFGEAGASTLLTGEETTACDEYLNLASGCGDGFAGDWFLFRFRWGGFLFCELASQRFQFRLELLELLRLLDDHVFCGLQFLLRGVLFRRG